MKRILLSAFAVCGILLQAQTTLISPSVENGGFEAGTAGWTIENGNQTNKWQVSTGAVSGFSGSNAIYVSNSSSAPYQHNYNTGQTSTVFFYKDVTFPAGETNANLSFKYIADGEGTEPYLYDYLRVFIVPTTFTPTAGDQPSTTAFPDYWSFNKKGTWQQASISIPPSALGNATAPVTKRILFMWRNDSSVGTQPPAAIDDITLVTSSINCPTVVSPAPNEQGLSVTPTITWSAVPGATSYSINIGTTPGGTDVLNNFNVGNTTSYTLTTPLSYITTYYYSVMASNGSVSSGACSINSFTTACTSYSAPYTQNFDNGVIPDCWSSDNPTYAGTDSNIFWKFGTGVDYGPDSNGRPEGTYAWVDASSPYTGVHTVNLTSPTINLAGLTSPTISFEWFKNHSTSSTTTIHPGYDDNKLTVSVNDGSGWTVLWNNSSNHNGWRDVELPLPASYLNKNIQVRFSVDKDVNGNGYYYDDLLVDNFKVDNASTCPKPTNLSISGYTGNNANVTWTAPTPAPSSYEVYYSTTSTAPTSLTTPTLTGITTTSVSIPGSATATTYVWVRSVCGPNDKSDWTSYVNFILPPTNDNCADAIELTVGQNFNSYPILGNITGASADIQPSCAYNLSPNVWFKATVPASGTLIVETQEAPGSYLDDTLIGVYTGSCGSLIELDCNDDNPLSWDLFSYVQLNNLTPGQTIYISVQKYSSSTDDGTFYVSAYDPNLLGTSELTRAQSIKVYPNPFKDIINISNAENYTSGVVVDMSGRVVKTLSKVQSQLDLGDLSAGVYVLNLTSKEGTKTSIKLVKK